MVIRFDWRGYYFAHIYSLWEQGSNENLNGLIRQYPPNKMVFDSISDEETKAAKNRLKYKTPYKLDSHLNVECRPIFHTRII